MAEENDSEPLETEDPDDSSSTAIGIALESAEGDPRLRAPVAAFLDKQSRMLDIQMEHKHEQRKLILSRLRWGAFSDRIRAALQLMTCAVALAIAAAFAVMVWDAGHSDGLLIEPFSVPPDLAQRGYTSEVVASKLLDNLVIMQAQTRSSRAAKSYVNSWDEKGIKLDIPETGVSFAELDAFLRRKLGHDIHVNGEIVRTGGGLNLTARAGAEGVDSVAGPDADFDALVQRLAESVYRMTQPFRYAVYLASHQRVEEALLIFKDLAMKGPALERPWGYLGWGQSTMEIDGFETLRLLQQALRLEPDNIQVRALAAVIEEVNSRPELSLRDYKITLSLLDKKDQAFVRPQSVARIRNSTQGGINNLTGAFHDNAQKMAEIARTDPALLPLPADQARPQIGEHNLASARATMAAVLTGPTVMPASIEIEKISILMLIDSEAQDWRRVLAEADAYPPLLRRTPGIRSFYPSMLAPHMAYAQARLGRIADAEALIAPTPGDCHICLMTRGRIAALKGEQARADWWFARAIASAPSIPIAYAEWARILLARGDAGGAITKAGLARQRGPRFADPLEICGEALMAQNRSDLALAKFEEADKYAPSWGRLHLKWGEALGYAGLKDKAKAQFDRAGQLDLTAPEKAELAKVSHG